MEEGSLLEYRKPQGQLQSTTPSCAVRFRTTPEPPPDHSVKHRTAWVSLLTGLLGKKCV